MNLKKLTLAMALAASFLGFSVSAQIGPATGGPSKDKLDQALTPETRQTLQDAMNSVDAAATETPAASGHELTIGPDEGAELDGAMVTRVTYASLPDSLKAALGGGVKGTLSGK